MMALFKKSVETLGAGALLKEMGDWWPTLNLSNNKNGHLDDLYTFLLRKEQIPNFR